MIIREMSDLHLEICPYFVPPMAEDNDSVLILSGDICTAYNLKGLVLDFFKSCSLRFKHVIYVPGNHEYYRGHLPKDDTKIQEFLTENNLDNIHFLNGSSIVLDGVAFVGATLWTDANKGDPLAKYAIEGGLNDYHVIRTQNYRKLRANDTILMHHNHKKFMFEEIVKYKAEGLKVVAISHHCPSSLSVAPRFRGDSLNAAYYSNLENEIMDTCPDYWFHGHTHDSFKYELGDTVVICNPRGYSKVWNKRLFDKLIEASKEKTEVKIDWMEFDEIFRIENYSFNPFLQVEI